MLHDIEANQQITAQTDAFPADEEQQIVTRQHQRQHEGHEEVEIGEEAIVAFFVRHVAGCVDVDQRADAGHDHQHDHGQLVDGEIPADVECAALNPGEVVFVDRVRADVARRHIHLHHQGERQHDAQDRDQINQRLRKSAPDNTVDQKTNEGERGDDPEILHQFLSESTSSMFRVVRFLNTVRIMARPTAASAAATTITKNVKMWPLTCLW